MHTSNNKNGTLMYGNLIIAEEKPFSLLEAVKKELIMKGYDRALFHKHYKPQKIMQKAQVVIPRGIQLDTKTIKSHIPAGAQDVAWYYQYVDMIGEESLFKIKDYVYGLCYKLNVGEHIDIIAWIDHMHIKCQNFKNWSIDHTGDLFIKILWCFLTESNGCYCFSNDYQKFINYIRDARKMD